MTNGVSTKAEKKLLLFDGHALASLTNLTQLTLGQNQISDVSPLASLTNLTVLNLKDNPIKTN